MLTELIEKAAEKHPRLRRFLRTTTPYDWFVLFVCLFIAAGPLATYVYFR